MKSDSKSPNPALTVTMLGDDASRAAEEKTVWIVRRGTAQVAMIVHQHTVARRASLARGAWFTVRFDHDDIPVLVKRKPARDFGAALAFVRAELAKDGG